MLKIFGLTIEDNVHNILQGSWYSLYISLF